MSSDHYEATQEPTVRRLRKAREEGHVARSSDLASVLFLILVIFLFVLWIPTFVEISKGLLITNLTSSGSELPAMFEGAGWQLVQVMLFPCILLLIAAIIAGFVQVGGLFVPSIIAMDVSRINMVSSWSRILGARAWMQLLFSTNKLLLASLVAILVVLHYSDQLLHIGLQESLEESIVQIGSIGLQTMAVVLSVLLILGVCDYFWQRYAWKSDHRMTRQEIIDEYRERESTSQAPRRHASWIAKKKTKSVTPSLFVVGTDVLASIRWNATSMSAPIVLDILRGSECETAIVKAKVDGILVVVDHVLAAQISTTSDAFLGIPPKLHGKIAGLLSTRRKVLR